MKIITNSDQTVFGIASDDVRKFFTGFDINGRARFSKTTDECATWASKESALAQMYLLEECPYFRVSAKWDEVRNV